MFEDFGDGGGTGMRAEGEIGVGELAPGGDDLVRFTCVGIEHVLEERIFCAGYGAFGDGGERVIHLKYLRYDSVYRVVGGRCGIVSRVWPAAWAAGERTSDARSETR